MELREGKGDSVKGFEEIVFPRGFVYLIPFFLRIVLQRGGLVHLRRRVISGLIRSFIQSVSWSFGHASSFVICQLVDFFTLRQ